MEKGSKTGFQVVVDNVAAMKLYCNYGFKKEVTGLEAEDEIFFKYTFFDERGAE